MEFDPDRLLGDLGLLIRREDGRDAALTEHHDLFEVLLRFRDQRDARGAMVADLVAYPFGAATGLAETATREHQPGQPVAGRRKLIWPCPRAPVPQGIKMRRDDPIKLGLLFFVQ